MKRTLSLAILAGLFLLPLTCRPQLANPPAYITGAKTINNSMRSLDLTATDNARNQWLFGSLGKSNLNNGPGLMVCDQDTATFADDLDIFVTSIDPQGKFRFLKKFSSDKLEFLNGFALDPTGNAALFYQSGGTTIVNGTTYPEATHFVFHLDQNGETDWLRTFNGAIFIDSRNSNVLIADNGDVIVSGIILPLSAGTIPTADFGDTVIAKKANPQLFINRYAKADGAMTMKIYDIQSEFEVLMIHKGINDEIWLNLNVFEAENINIDGHQLNFNQQGGIAMVRMNGQAEVLDVNDYFTKSYFTKWIPLPDGTIRGLAFCAPDATEKASGNDINSTQSDIPMIFSLGPDGKLEWIKPITRQFHYLDVNPTSGDALISFCDNLTNPSYSIYNGDGALIQSTILQTQYNRFAFAANFDKDSAVYISSYVNRDLTVNGTKYTFGDIQDMAFVIAKLPYSANTSFTFSREDCVPYMFHGIEVTESGTYTVVIPNSYNGDSIITMNFTEIPATYSDLDVKQCISYTSPSGKIFTETGVYQDTISNVGGCDSIITINLTIDDTQIELWGTAANCAQGAGAVYSAALCGTESNSYPFELDAEGASPVYVDLLPFNGRLYGMNSEGGRFGLGMIFSYDPLLEDYRTEFSFDDKVEGATPQGSLILASNGKMYGFIRSRTVFNFGGIIEFDPVTRACSRTTNFTLADGWIGDGKFVDGGDGKLYGVTTIGGAKSTGALISYVPGESSYTKLADFDASTNGSNPVIGLCKAANGKFYGTASEGGANGKGTIVEFDAATGTLLKLADFTGVNGSKPYGTLTETGDGRFFGMTYSGGSADNGVIYEFNPATAAITVSFDFPASGSGSKPYGNLTQASNGLLYGFTSMGGSNNNGTLFSFDPITSAFVLLTSMDFRTIGSKPQGTPVEVDGKLYGMNNYGGSQNRGTLIVHDISQNNTYKKIDLEKPSAGATPTGKLLLAENGLFYGTTSKGGANNYGTLYSFDPKSKTFATLKDFEIFTSGASSTDGLIQTRSGRIFGVSGSGGGLGGVLYEYQIANNFLTPRFSFGPSGNGYRPDCNVIEASNDMLYGTATKGGANNDGVIYSYDPNTNTYKKLYDFAKSTGGYPRGGLCEVREGLLAGMTWEGGSANLGVVYTYDVKTNTYEVIGNFDGSNGSGPYGNLMKASNGKVYGLATGSFFEFDVDKKQIRHLLTLPNYANNPRGTLMEASNGKLYATSTTDIGSVFEIDLSTLAIRELMQFNCENGGYPNSGYLVEQSECNMSAMVEVTKLACFGGGKDGIANVKITGGSSPFRYEWSGKGYYDFADSLEAGMYTVKIKDGRNCEVSVPFVVTESANPDMSIDPFPILCKDNAPYTLKEGHPEGGSYSGTGVADGKFDPAVSGVGEFTITYSIQKDSCTYKVLDKIKVDGCSGISNVQPDWLKVYPNPAKDKVVVSFENQQAEQLEVTDIAGKQLLVKSLISNSVELNLEGISAGAYLIRLMKDGETFTTKLLITK